MSEVGKSVVLTIENLDLVEDRAKEILAHVEAIKKLQAEIGPYNSVRLTMRFEPGAEER